MGNPAYTLPKIDELSILKLEVSEEMLTATVSDGRIISIPVAWFERLRDAKIEEIKKFEISPSGYGVHFPLVDEDISIKAFLGF